MQLSQLIQRFRTLANDKVEPYFNDDESIIDWLNDAENEACIRGRLLHESRDDAVCKIAVTTGTSHYPLHPSLYELSRIWFKPADSSRGDSVSLTSVETLNHLHGRENWTEYIGCPCLAVQDDTVIRLVPRPNLDGELQLEGYRVPLIAMEDDTDKPEINQIHHVQLIQWALHKAYSVPDSEFFDPNRSALAEQAFTDYFGPRPDSDLRRMTREDTPHVVQPFLP